MDLFWIPLGAGGHSVRVNGRIYEAIAATRRYVSNHASASVLVLDHGYVPGEHEPDLTSVGIGSNPNYLPTNPSGEQIVCEVKAFGPNRLTRRLQLGRPFSTLGDELWPLYVTKSGQQRGR